MFVVELFVPLDRGDGSEVRAEEIDTILRDLTNRFGGATAFTRAPATGLWKDGAETTSDRIIIIEIMADPSTNLGGLTTALASRRSSNRTKFWSEGRAALSFKPLEGTGTRSSAAR